MKMKGPGLIAVSAFFFATYGIWSKMMAGHFGEFNQATVKAVILLSVLVPYGLLTRGLMKIKRQDWKWFTAIGLCGGLNQAPYFFGFEHLSVGTATLLFYAALTLGAYGLGLMFFREKLNGAKIGALVMAMVGLAVIYELHLTPGQLLPAAATFAAGLMGATGVVLSKKLSGNYPEFQIILAYLVAMIVVNPVMSFFLGEKLPDPAVSGAWLAQIGYAASYLIANTTVVAGFKHLDPSIGALIGLLEVLFAAGFGVILFGEEITVQLLAGGSLILAAAGLPDMVSLMQRKYYGKPHDHKSGQPGG